MAKINRRDFLRGLGAGAVLLNPILSMLARAELSGAAAKRFIYMFSANGTVLDNWRPSGSATEGSLRLNSTILTPLADYQDKITVIQGVHNNTGGPGDDHVRGVLSSLTAMRNNEGTVYTVNSATGYNSGRSIDQYIAQQVGANSIVAGAQSGSSGSGGFFSLLSSKGSNQPVQPVMDPKLLHTNLFSNINSGGGAAPSLSETDAINMRNKSILDFATADITRLKNRLPASLSARLSDHADAIRTLESKISIPPPLPPAACSVPTVGTAYSGNSLYPAAISMQMKNIVYAMACGVSNSAVLVLGGGVDLHAHTWLGIQDEHHTISHLTDGTAQTKLTEINKWYAQRFKELLDILSSVNDPSGGGTMLDTSLVVWGNELSAGANHSHQNLPYVLAGATGKMPGGRYLTAANKGHGELLVSFGRAMGYNLNSFGSGNQPLPDLIG